MCPANTQRYKNALGTPIKRRGRSKDVLVTFHVSLNISLLQQHLCAATLVLTLSQRCMRPRDTMLSKIMFFG